MTKVIVSEELAQDALEDFDTYLADELGQRIAALEEPAFATGDGTGKPLGITTSGNGVTRRHRRDRLRDRLQARRRPCRLRRAPRRLPAHGVLAHVPVRVLVAHRAHRHGGQPRPTQPPRCRADVVLSARPRVGGHARRRCQRPLRRRRRHPARLRRPARAWARSSEAGGNPRDNGQLAYRAFERLDGRIVLVDAFRILANSVT